MKNLGMFALLFFSSLVLAEDSDYAVFAVAEKNDFAIRLLPDKQDFYFGYDDSIKKHAVYTTNSDALAGVGLRYKEMKLVYSKPVSLESELGIGSSEGQSLRLQFFHLNHFLMLQSTSMRTFYQIEPAVYDGDATRVFPRRGDISIESRRARYSYSFEPENYSLKTKFLQLEVDTMNDGATFLLDFRVSQDLVEGGSSGLVPVSLQDELTEDYRVTGFSSLQLSPMAGLAYMMREQTVFASLDLYGGWSYQKSEIYRNDENQNRTTSGLAYSAELAGGLVLQNAYLSFLLHLDSFQLPLAQSYLELTRSYFTIESGLRF
jgi:hypothetical protein